MKDYSNRFVFYSKTDDNPFIDRSYVEQLRHDMSPKEAMRYLDGLWIELKGEVIYYEYDSPKQYLKDTVYKVDETLPVGLTFDFNIAVGKPISACLFQYKDDAFHVFAESVIHGGRTAEVLDDLDSRGLFDSKILYEIYGDAAGKHKDTRSSRSDYDIIMQELKNRGYKYTYCIPPSNPPIRTRHNKVNAYCKNANGDVRLFIYKGCEVSDEGFRLTKLKDKGAYIEDDSKHYQHITTAVGYAIVFIDTKKNRQKQGTVIL